MTSRSRRLKGRVERLLKQTATAAEIDAAADVDVASVLAGLEDVDVTALLAGIEDADE